MSWKVLLLLLLLLVLLLVLLLLVLCQHQHRHYYNNGIQRQHGKLHVFSKAAPFLHHLNPFVCHAKCN